METLRRLPPLSFPAPSSPICHGQHPVTDPFASRIMCSGVMETLGRLSRLHPRDKADEWRGNSFTAHPKVSSSCLVLMLDLICIWLEGRCDREKAEGCGTEEHSPAPSPPYQPPICVWGDRRVVVLHMPQSQSCPALCKTHTPHRLHIIHTSPSSLPYPVPAFLTDVWCNRRAAVLQLLCRAQAPRACRHHGRAWLAQGVDKCGRVWKLV